MTYTIEEHRHRFAVWTAARAVQRGFSKTANISAAVDVCGIRGFVESYDEQAYDPDAYDADHKSWCNCILDDLRTRADIDPELVRYGRAAKIVAVYLKTTFIVRDPLAKLAHVAHPPIDRILLQEAAKKAPRRSALKQRLKEKNWTELVETEYFDLIEDLRSFLPKGAPFWHLEKFWMPAKLKT
ncbi:MAG: hypothetical protein H6954_05300 [Chromatiaceae bacterium]|nr:hypothetical protein [Chromatiaceae bacterium]